MNTVERVIAICKEKGITLSRLEKECGFGNGYIGKKLKSGMLPADRLSLISDFLGVDYSYLLTGEKEHNINASDDHLLTIIDCYNRLGQNGKDILYNVAYALTLKADSIDEMMQRAKDELK